MSSLAKHRQICVQWRLSEGRITCPKGVFCSCQHRGGRSCAASPTGSLQKATEACLNCPSCSCQCSPWARHPPVGPTSPVQWLKHSRYWTTNKASQALSQGLLIRPLLLHKILWLILWWSEPSREEAVHGLNNSPLVPQEGSRWIVWFEQGNLSPTLF